MKKITIDGTEYNAYTDADMKCMVLSHKHEVERLTHRIEVLTNALYELSHKPERNKMADVDIDADTYIALYERELGEFAESDFSDEEERRPMIYGDAYLIHNGFRVNLSSGAEYCNNIIDAIKCMDIFEG